VAPRDHAHHRLYVAVHRDHRWAALFDDNRLVEFHLEQEGERNRVGDVYFGRIIRVDNRLDAAFIDIGGKQAAFLPLTELAAPAVEGAKVVVQIEREGRGEKGPRVTARPAFAGVRLVLLPGRRAVLLSERITDKAERARLSILAKAIVGPGEGLTIRTSAIGATEDNLRNEIAALRTAWREVSELQRSRQPPAVLWRQLPVDLRLLRDHGLSFEGVYYDHRGAADAARSWCRNTIQELAPRVRFQNNTEWRFAPAEILEQLEDAIRPRVALPSGGSIHIEPTEAATVIDVNTASVGVTPANDCGERLFLQTNLAAAREIARQIRLRNIGGIIVVDFIDLGDAVARRQVVDCLRAAAAWDSAPVWVGTMSRLGLVELTRKQRGPTLMDTLTRPCSACDGTGRVVRGDTWMRAMSAT